MSTAWKRDEVGVTHTVASMSATTLALIGALLGLASGAPLALIAARRAARQPVDYDIAAELTLLNWILDRPGRLVRLAQLEADHFASADHARLWDLMRTTAGELPTLADDAEESIIEAAEALIDVDLRATVANLEPELYAALLNGSADHESNNPASGLAAAQRVFTAGEDRLRYPGGSPIERGTSGEAPLVRRYRPPQQGRIVAASILGAAAGSLTPLLADHVWPDGAAFLLSILALTALSVGSIIWALVDHDTLLIDLETFFPLAGLAWVLTIAAGFAGGEPIRALHGFALSVALAVFFRVINAIYGFYKLRTTGVRVDGMGGGDSWLVLATAGVPAALAGSVNLWYLCAMSGMVAAIAIWLLRWPTRWRIERTTPFAFGPYLALGWIIGGAAAVSGLQLW